jgi:hypothetical protein
MLMIEKFEKEFTLILLKEYVQKTISYGEEKTLNDYFVSDERTL